MKVKELIKLLAKENFESEVVVHATTDIDYSDRDVSCLLVQTMGIGRQYSTGEKVIIIHKHRQGA